MTALEDVQLGILKVGFMFLGGIQDACYIMLLCFCDQRNLLDDDVCTVKMASTISVF
jgi:hypothetical protein